MKIRYSIIMAALAAILCVAACNKPVPVSPEEPETEQPDEEKPGEENPGEEQPGEENPGEEQPGEDNPGEDNPGDVEKPEISNAIEFNGVAQDIYGSFYMEDGGYVYLYFTPQQIDWFYDDEFPFTNAKDWACVVFESTVLDGNSVDLSAASPAYQIYYSYDFGEGSAVMTNMGETPEGSGSLVVTRSDTKSFTLSLDAVMPGEQALRIAFDGIAKHVDEIPEEPCEFVCGTETWTISSAILDLTGGLTDVYGETCLEIWLCAESGCTSVADMKEHNSFHIVAPMDAMNSTVGFSMFKDEPNFYFEYGERKWNYSIEPGTGTLILSVNDDETEMTVEFRDYNGLSGYYSGSFTYIK